MVTLQSPVPPQSMTVFDHGTNYFSTENLPLPPPHQVLAMIDQMSNHRSTKMVRGLMLHYPIPFQPMTMVSDGSNDSLTKCHPIPADPHVLSMLNHGSNNCLTISSPGFPLMLPLHMFPLVVHCHIAVV
jgi:hypothetical protein